MQQSADMQIIADVDTRASVHGDMQRRASGIGCKHMCSYMHVSLREKGVRVCMHVDLL